MIRYRNGFTLIEVLVTVIIVGLLASISIVAYGRFQADSRDAQRASRTTILFEALEKYYGKNGEYPGCAAMTQNVTTITTTVLPGVDTQAFITPKAPAGTTNSITCTALSGTSGPDVFAYVGDGTPTCSTGAACTSFTLQYREEANSGAIKSTPSRH